MNCKHVQSLLSAYIDEELTGAEMLDIRGHLNKCESCAEDLRCVTGLKRLLGSVPVPEPSADFEERLVTRVMSASGHATHARNLSWVWFTGVAAVSMLATMLMLNLIHREPPVVTDQSEAITEALRSTRAFDSSDNPLMASPVVFRRH